MNKDIKDNVFKLLSDYLGVEPEDISEEDSLYQDLHMRAPDLTDFVEILQSEGFETEGVDLTALETVCDLIYALGGETYSNAGPDSETDQNTEEE